MTFDNIRNLENYASLNDIYMDLRFLSVIDKQNFPKEKVRIDGNRIFARPVTLTSKPVEDCMFEAHHKYIDIHYIIAGKEGISTRSTCELTPVDDFKEIDDIGFFQGVPSGTCYLRPGEFVVCWTQDAHRVAMMDGKPGEITKIVVKVKI